MKFLALQTQSDSFRCVQASIIALQRSHKCNRSRRLLFDLEVPNELEINVDRQAGETERPNRHYFTRQSRGPATEPGSRTRQALAVFGFQRGKARRARLGCPEIP